MPERLVAALRVLGHDVDSVRMERLSGSADATVWNETQLAGRFFITQDLDFSDTRIFEPGTHRGLLIVRLRRPGRTALFDRVAALFSTERVEDWARAVVVATDRKVRVRERGDS